MDLDHRPAGEIASTAVWLEDSLGYARAAGRRKLVGLLETVGAEIELEGALLALPPGKHLGLAPGERSGRGHA